MALALGLALVGVAAGVGLVGGRQKGMTMLPEYDFALERKLMHPEDVPFCMVSGDPGCLGWPEWHQGDCIYEPVECWFCECGGHDVYSPGECFHDEVCALYIPGDEATDTQALARAWAKYGPNK